MLIVNEILSQPGKPASMYISWVEYQPFMKVNMEYYLFDIIAQVKSFGIKTLLLDPRARQAIPSDDNFKAFYELLLSALSDTELEKFARISIANQAIEARFQGFLQEIKENLKVEFKVRNFSGPEEAKIWLGVNTTQQTLVTEMQY